MRSTEGRRLPDRRPLTEKLQALAAGGFPPSRSLSFFWKQVGS